MTHTNNTNGAGQSAGAALDGRVALVTGSSSGIGAAIATSLAHHGATVVVNSATSVEAGERLAAALPQASYIQADVSQPDQASRLIETTVERHGRLDILVNNAGTTTVIPHHDLDAATPDIWEQILRVNVIGTWNVIRAAAPPLRQAGEGVIINISSLAGVRPVGSSIPYAVSKAAVNHLTVLLANALGPEIRRPRHRPRPDRHPLDIRLARRAASRVPDGAAPTGRDRPGRRRHLPGAHTGPLQHRTDPARRRRNGPAMTTVLTPEQCEFLAAHQWAVLATSRQDGSPQQSLVGYTLDPAGRIIISTKAYTAKWHNAIRQPHVSLTVTDGRTHLVIYGMADPVADDPRRAELTADVFSRLSGGPRPDPTSLVPTLDEQQRTILQITPTKALFHE